MKNILYVILFFLFSCNSTKEIYEIKFEVDSKDIENVLLRIQDENLNSIKLEKEAFLSSKYNNDSLYLNTLNNPLGEIKLIDF